MDSNTKNKFEWYGCYKSNNSSNVTEVIMTHTQLSLLANLFDGKFLKDNDGYISFINHEEALDLRVEQIAEYELCGARPDSKDTLKNVVLCKEKVW